ncbi:hypothetical protein [Sphingomonas melonis]|jgi:hypothetical protein|uniref:hypothetical protein n=1 Tax=Sphingomonas melonis TaxID=152682 RepID=UPI0036A91C92
MSVEITQADREAAAQIYIWFPALSSSVDAAHKTAQLIRDGGADGWNSVRLMRDHRHQAEEAMRERISMLEKLLSDCADELAAEVEARFERVWGHPGMRHRIERDMNTVVAARAAIRSIDTRGE